MPGHAPTNVNGPPAWSTPPPNAANFKGRGGGRPKDKERECLEAIQNLDEITAEARENLSRRYPPGMVKRLVALHSMATDSTSKDCLNAQRLIRDILSHQRGLRDSEMPPPSATITLLHGAADVPMPGTKRPPQECSEGASDEPVEESV